MHREGNEVCRTFARLHVAGCGLRVAWFAGRSEQYGLLRASGKPQETNQKKKWLPPRLEFARLPLRPQPSASGAACSGTPATTVYCRLCAALCCAVLCCGCRVPYLGISKVALLSSQCLR